MLAVSALFLPINHFQFMLTNIGSRTMMVYSSRNIGNHIQLRGADVIFSPNNLSGATKRVYDYLYDEIVSGRLVPGSALSEQEISARLQTSRSPVREAMMVLESKGMVRRYPGRGCFVAEITVQDLKEIFGLRALLEVEALRLSYQLLDRHKLEQLYEDLQRLTPEAPTDAYFETDRRLHELLINSCGNMRLILILRTLNGQIEQLRRISARQPQRLSASRQEHLDIIRALLDGDLEQSCQHLRNHISNIQASTLSVCIQAGIRDRTD